MGAKYQIKGVPVFKRSLTRPDSITSITCSPGFSPESLKERKIVGGGGADVPALLRLKHRWKTK